MASIAKYAKAGLNSEIALRFLNHAVNSAFRTNKSQQITTTAKCNTWSMQKQISFSLALAFLRSTCIFTSSITKCETAIIASGISTEVH
jgi:hypothetical protein